MSTSVRLPSRLVAAGLLVLLASIVRPVTAGASTGDHLGRGRAAYEQRSKTAKVFGGHSRIVSVSCSPPNLVVGGGFAVSDGNVVKVASSLPSSDHSWEVSVVNTSGSRQWVTVIAVCVSRSSVSGYEQPTTTVSLGPGPLLTEVSVACSPGNKIVGGGFGVQNPTVSRVNSSEPALNFVISDHNWDALAANLGNGTEQVTVTGICVSGSVSGYEEQLQHTLVSSGPSTVSASCSPANEVFGGGFLVEEASIVLLNASQPTSHGAWSTSVNNTDTRLRVVEAVAICVASPPKGHHYHDDD